MISKMSNNKFELKHICYADFEASTDGYKHEAYCVCYNLDGIDKSYYGHNCAINFLKSLPTNTLVYFHNLSYDITFIIDHMYVVYDNPIIKQNRTISLIGQFKVSSNLITTIAFKDSYSIIPAPLKRFPIMFHLDSGRKEVFPYDYYTYDRTNQIEGDINEALQFIPETEHEAFIHNVNAFAKLDNPEKFNMRDYAIFYCKQDVNILRKGFEWFRNSLIKEFNIDAYNFVSIPSIANRFMEMNCYWINRNLYDLANTPREFISRCITGGRCMLADNVKHKVDNVIVDFDAVSLYPSAMNRLYCLEGIPKVLTKDMLSTSFLLEHLFEDEQIEPNMKRFISGFFVEAKINYIGKQRHFPLIVYDHEYNHNKQHERSTNDTCIMYMDHITYYDLIYYQHCNITPIRGYYYSGKRDIRIREVVQQLFQLRLRYKQEGNPLQEIVKLLLNSIYGKTILKPINEKHKFIKQKYVDDYIRRRYNYIKEISGEHNRNLCLVKEVKPYSKHFTFCTLGVNILSMSKRIMNEVFCTGEDIGCNIYYQDTDSFFIDKADLHKLSDEFSKRYKRNLIGKDLGQFHCDLETFGDSDKMPVGIHSIFCGKKCYIVQLENDFHQIAFHIRMKGIIPDVIVKKANMMFPDYKKCIYENGLCYPSYETTKQLHEYSIMKLYEYLYDGNEITFDLCDSDLKQCFDIKNMEVTTKQHFERIIKFE